MISHLVAGGAVVKFIFSIKFFVTHDVFLLSHPPKNSPTKPKKITQPPACICPLEISHAPIAITATAVIHETILRTTSAFMFSLLAPVAVVTSPV
jgi:hypothetical protein